MARVFVGITTTASQYIPVQSSKLNASEVLSINSGERKVTTKSAGTGDGKYWVIMPLDAELVWVNFEGQGANEVGWPVKSTGAYFESQSGKKPDIFVP